MIKTILKQIFHYPRLLLDEPDYNDYWRNKRGAILGCSSGWQRYRASWILDRIDEGDSVLDIGCGDGGVLLYMLTQKKINPIGADVSEICLNFLSSKDIPVIKFDATDIDSIGKLPESDHVLVLEVLEHMSNPEKFLKLISNKATKSIFFSFPNSGYFAYRLRLLFGSFPMQWALHPGEHLRFWTYRDLKWWLKELELSESSIIHVYEGIPLLNRLWKGLFGAAFIVEVKI